MNKKKAIIISIIASLAAIIITILSVLGYNYSTCDDKATTAIAKRAAQEISYIRDGGISFVSFDKVYFEKSIGTMGYETGAVGSIKANIIPTGKNVYFSFTAKAYTNPFTGDTYCDWIDINDDYLKG